MILLNDFQRQWAEVGADALAAIDSVGKSGWYILGKAVSSFEAALAARYGRRFAAGCGNGLDAIEIALRGLGLRPGDKVLTTPLSAFATTLAIVRAGGVPVFLDVQSQGGLDLQACGRFLETRPDVKFMVPVHLYGHPLDLAALAALRDRFGLKVVEDCAQSIDAAWGDRLAGSVGAAATVSFYPTKNLGALGDAGAVLTDDAGLQDSFAALRNYGQAARYSHTRLGLNSRLDEVHAATLERALLPRLSGWTARRRAIAARYLAELEQPQARPVPPPPGGTSAWHLFPVLVPPDARGDFQAHLQRSGVQSAIHYPILIVDQPALAEATFEVAGDLAVGRRFAAGEVSLPIHPYLTDPEVTAVVAAVNSWRAP